METAPTPEAPAPEAADLQAAYLDYLLTHGAPPVSVYAFTKSLGLAETEFYNRYNSFAALEQRIWADLFAQTRQRLAEEPQYADYAARQKLLAFYFTWVDVLRPQRSFVLHTVDAAERLRMGKTPTSLHQLKKEFLGYAADLVNEGLDKGELVSRPLLTNRYADGLWAQLLFVTKYWAHDTTPGFEQTDAAIEKAVRLSFELMGSNVVDAATDFFKFLWQRK